MCYFGVYMLQVKQTVCKQTSIHPRLFAFHAVAYFLNFYFVALGHRLFLPQEEDSERAASVVQLPKVDSRDQAIIRRNILHQKLSKV